MSGRAQANDPPKPARAPLLTSRDIQAMLALYSGRAEYLFVHIPKNAGVSVRKSAELSWRLVGVHKQFLRDRAYLNDLLLTMGKAGQHHGIAHARLRDIKPWIVDRLQPVAILRNPWARTVSRFRFAQQAARANSRFALPNVEDFEAFLDTRHDDGALPFFWHRAIRGWYPQRDYVVDAKGNLIADLLRQEHLNEDTTAYFGLTAPPRPRNVTVDANSDDWKSYYSPETIQIVADWYASDIETFGFDFDTAATRNVWALR